jgi:hypothetical protein
MVIYSSLLAVAGNCRRWAFDTAIDSVLSALEVRTMLDHGIPERPVGPMEVWTADRARQAGYEDGRSAGQAVRAAAVPAHFQRDYQNGFAQCSQEYAQKRGPDRNEGKQPRRDRKPQ